MVDIIDVVLARALTPQGQIESYAAQSQAAVTKANAAVAQIETITEQTNTNNANAAEALAAAEQAMENASAAEARIESALEGIQGATTQQIDDEMDKLAISLSQASNSTYNSPTLVLTMPSGETKTIENLIKMYSSTGQNTDGTMTQKAITDAITSAYNALEIRINNIPTSGGSGGISNLGTDAAGHIVIVGPDGNITASDMTESELIQALMNPSSYSTGSSVGLTIDYENKSFERTQDAASYTQGADFNKYSMFGGRMRCNVSNDGTITAFYGDSNYTEDGSNGQVMVYQPKFYYQRTLMSSSVTARGTKVYKESLILSPTARAGFTLHPLFKSGDVELDYVLLPAYEGSVEDVSQSSYLKNNESGVTVAQDRLSSIAGALPLNGYNNTISLDNLKQLARNRGTGWQLTTIEFESANQMLEMVEFGTTNVQTALESGVVSISKNSNDNCAAVTGSTASLGNATGAAASTTVVLNGNSTAYSTPGSRAISYRGMENPWGNQWRIVGNMTVKGTGSNAGSPYYNSEATLNITLPSASSNWVESFGADANYDWVYMPLTCGGNANSALPIGDSLWSLSNLNGETILSVGGICNSGNAAGIFHYGCDISTTATIRASGGRIMFVPQKNSIYNNNITKWRQHYGG